MMKAFLTLPLLALATAAAAQDADTSPAALIARYEGEAGTTAAPERGQELFMGTHTGGKEATPSCTTCHTQDPHNVGQTRAGKRIDPMATSVNPDRFTVSADVEKWFRRNCNSVLGRACTSAEKADIIAFLSSL